ncbi:MAG: Crp/Fnr family transcriptional regulator [Terrimicrobiaceae bacterium]|nr:Crp/Fnr family transcriptional regulator [Terrimicrobiaceae bacterium]
MAKSTSRDERASLENAALFRDLSDRQKAALAEIAVARRFPRGEIILRQGSPSAGFYVIRSGAVNVHRLSPDGTERVIRLFRAGESFAEASLLPGGVYPASARAVVDCRLLLIPKALFLALLKRDADFGLRMIVALSMRCHALIASIESLRGESMQARILRWLLSRCPAAGSPVSYTIHLATTKAVLAAELGMRQETLSRHLANLRESGDLAVRGREIVVLNRSRLQALLSETGS